MRVRAAKLGYYELKRRRPGDVFELKEGDKLPSWAEPVDTEKPEPKTATQSGRRGRAQDAEVA